MRNKDDIDAYLGKSPYTYEELEENTWLVHDASLEGSPENVVIRLSDDIVLFRVNVLDLEEVPAQVRGELFAMLLELNATDMVHGAYGVQLSGSAAPKERSSHAQSRLNAAGKVMLTSSMRLENLDYSEFVGTLDDFTVALAKHHELIASFAKP